MSESKSKRGKLPVNSTHPDYDVSTLLLGWCDVPEGVEFGFGDVAAEGFAEVRLEIAAADVFADAEQSRFDAVGTELLAEPAVGDGVAVADVFPWPVAHAIEVVDEITGKDAVGFGQKEGGKDVEQQ